MFLYLSLLALPLCTAYTVVNPNKLPHQSEKGQYGYNDCGTKDSPSAKCQTSWVTSIEDFCLFAPPTKATIGDSERYEVTWCTKAHHGARLIPKGAIKSAHLLQTKDYLQITGTGDFTKMNIVKGDEGGELDPHGADGNGNPIGGLVLTSVNGYKQQLAEWTQFISSSLFCIRACFPGSKAAANCQHIYDEMGCFWNMPANYNSGFDTCKADSTKWPMGLYPEGKGTSTFYQGEPQAPAAWSAPKSSQCVKAAAPAEAKY